MKVRVGEYAYLWEGAEPLVPGDRVLLPENWLSRMTHGPGPFEDTVTAVGRPRTTSFANDGPPRNAR